MNSEEQAGTEVLVELSSCSKEDAGTVFDALRTSFTSDRGTDEMPRDTAGPRPTVWAATFDVRGDRGTAKPTPLADPVTADLQGGYRAVDRLRSTLASVFAVQVVGAASGDQERELQLRLETRQPVAH